MNQEKLVRMANQIAGFFAHEGPERATLSIEDHLRKFWDPRMRDEIVAALADGRAAGLHPLAAAAIERLGAAKTA